MAGIINMQCRPAVSRIVCVVTLGGWGGLRQTLP
jgi:hypothetical protein